MQATADLPVHVAVAQVQVSQSSLCEAEGRVHGVRRLRLRRV